MAGGRFKELLKKYGKVAFGVHMSVSAASITSLYVAIKNNVDVESLFQRFHLPGLRKDEAPRIEDSGLEEEQQQQQVRNRTAELAASSGGALALAILCNKVLFPVRVPITIALTPPIARFLARKNIIKNAL